MKAKYFSKYQNSILVKSLSVLSKSDRKKLAVSTSFQILLSFLDLLGVAIFGVLGALAITGIESSKPGNKVTYILNLSHLNELNFKTQIIVLGATAGLILIVKTFMSMWITWKTLFFLGNKSAEISQLLLKKILSQSLIEIKSKNSQEIIFLVTSGVDMITLRVLGSAISIFSDCALLIVMSVGLLILDPTVAIYTFITFAFLGYGLYSLSSKRVKSFSRDASLVSINANQTVMESIDTYRESVVRNTRQFYVEKFRVLRLRIASNNAYISFTPNIGKYVLEGVVTLGSLALAGYQFFTKDAVHAIATLTVFMAAGSRVAPAALRIQQNSLQIRGNSGSALDALQLIDHLSLQKLSSEDIQELDVIHSGFIPEVEISKLNFKYENDGIPIIQNLDLQIAPGSFVAIVGPSGAGKTTLVDLILGLMNPNSGLVKISGQNPLEAFKKWPGAIAYVPQNVAICDGTISENISLGFAWNPSFEPLIVDAVDKASLKSFLKTLPNGLDTQVGDRGTLLSGGQKQRIGIARALFTNPSLLVLDEATSSLDGETELAISDALLNLKGKMTQIVIAHRLSTVRNADVVLYFGEGRLVASGSFDEVRSQVPDFDRQAALMGL